VAVAQPLAERDDGRWWWMPLGVTLLLVTAAAIAFIPARNAPTASRHRWRPGDRIPPQPLGETDLS
jgi:hypothetical protein